MNRGTGESASARSLRRLFLTLFLRGRSARGLRRETTPKSIGSKLGLTLGMYGLFGMTALLFLHQQAGALSLYLHAMTFLILGMFVSTSAADVLFNKEEADILLHRPVTPRSLLWAKVAVLVQVSLWIAGALNLCGCLVGIAAPGGGWRFPLAHAVSTSVEALFCAGSVVLVFQLCLRWAGRERLDAVMTTAQVLFSILVVVGSQVVPHLVGRYHVSLDPDSLPRWAMLIPAAWFAGFDDALAGSGALNSWVLGGVGLAVTGVVMWLAFGKLASAHQAGVPALGEALPSRPGSGRRSWLRILVGLPPLRWWLRDSVARASFLLTAAYLGRDREVKLRLYPGLAPLVVMPLIVFLPGARHDGVGGFGVAFSGSYLGLVPLMALDQLQYSQQWPAADVFRTVPMTGPARLCHGARRAVLCCLTFPALVLSAAVVLLVGTGPEHLLFLLPGIIALPIYAMIPCMGGKAVPFSRPTETAHSSGRVFVMIGVMACSGVMSAVAALAWRYGWYQWLLLAEILIVGVVYRQMRAALEGVRWPSLD